MQYLLSMDGGGTKTKWLLTDTFGNKIDTLLETGCSHPQIGVKQVCLSIQCAVNELLERNHALIQNLAGICMGVPCYGEVPDADRYIFKYLSSCFENLPLTICNDVELGFWGAQPEGRGIHLVAGTGAIAYARNPSSSQAARCNGWHYLLSDEGSGYWLGMLAISLYLKEDDGRIEKGALHDIVSVELGIQNALDMTLYYDSHLAGKRKEIAALQELLSKAAKKGDQAAIQAYQTAAHELALSASALKNKLFPDCSSISVSYSGGIFKNGRLIFDALDKELKRDGLYRTSPMLSPEFGGIWLAAKSCHLDSPNLLSRLKEQQ